jgi:hypothetical protein
MDQATTNSGKTTEKEEMEFVRLTSGELRHDSPVHMSIRAIGYGNDVSEVISNMAL